MINKHPGYCYVCGVLVDAGEGEVTMYKSKFLVKHNHCTPVYLEGKLYIAPKVTRETPLRQRNEMINQAELNNLGQKEKKEDDDQDVHVLD